jgi:hypothetical protein
MKNVFDETYRKLIMEISEYSITTKAVDYGETISVGKSVSSANDENKSQNNFKFFTDSNGNMFINGKPCCFEYHLKATAPGGGCKYDVDFDIDFDKIDKSNFYINDICSSKWWPEFGTLTSIDKFKHFMNFIHTTCDEACSEFDRKSSQISVYLDDTLIGPAYKLPIFVKNNYFKIYKEIGSNYLDDDKHSYVQWNVPSSKAPSDSDWDQTFRLYFRLIPKVS